jgi:predicted metal-dependent enzyme (double-stranded beta helix superfamily)
MNLEIFCNRFQTLLDQAPSTPLMREDGRQLFQDLIQNPLWLGKFLQKFMADSAFLSDQPVSFFDNEIKLYRSPDKSFILLAYIWDRRDLSPIHDHGAWGIIGALMGPLREIKYQRLDNSQVEGYAELKQISDTVIAPGETVQVLPLDKGIHQTGATDDQLTITINVYGKSIRQGYIHCFDPAEKKVTRAHRRIHFRRPLALQALVLLGEAVGENFFTPDLIKSLPEDLVKEFQRISSVSEKYL